MNSTIDNLVNLLAKQLKQQEPVQASPAQKLSPEATSKINLKYTRKDYPMLQKHGDIIKTPTGKNMQELTLQAVLDGQIAIQDVRISKEMLYAQADIAADAGKGQVGENLRRAAELIKVPDDVVIQMYNLLRPNRATAEQLLEMAKILREKYDAPLCANLVEEALEIYSKRKILK